MQILQRDAIDAHSRDATLFQDSYDRDPYQSCFAYSRMRLAPLLEKYIPHDGTGKTVLDVGCGPGIYMEQIQKLGYKVTGVDGSDEMLELARKRHPKAELKKGMVEALPFPDASFDVALCIEVLRYLPDPAACVREIGRILKPGGVALATALPLCNANGYFVVNQVTALVQVGSLHKLRQKFQTSRELEHDFEHAGFKSVDVHGVYTGAINWVERLAPKLLRPALKAWEPVDAALADRGPLKEFANMFLVHAIKG